MPVEFITIWPTEVKFISFVKMTRNYNWCLITIGYLFGPDETFSLRGYSVLELGFSFRTSTLTFKSCLPVSLINNNPFLGRLRRWFLRSFAHILLPIWTWITYENVYHTFWFLSNLSYLLVCFREGLPYCLLSLSVKPFYIYKSLKKVYILCL